MSGSNVRHLDIGVINPTELALHNHLRSALDAFLEQHPVSVASALGVLETIKLTIWAEANASDDWVASSE